MAKRRKKFLVIDGCPCPRDVAPYVYLVLRRAGQTANSIYRGSDPEARAILHRHGKHTQAELHADPRYRNISNPEGLSEHDLHSDGHARPGPPGRHLAEWQIGVDSGTDSPHDKAAIEAAAHHYGLRVGHPYSRGVEGHHWHFVTKPKADRKHLTRTRVIITRARLSRNK